MISDLESNYKRIRAEQDILVARIDVANETLEALNAELQDKFHSASVEEANALLKKLAVAKQSLETQIEATLASVLD